MSGVPVCQCVAGCGPVCASVPVCQCATLSINVCVPVCLGSASEFKMSTIIVTEIVLWCVEPLSITPGISSLARCRSMCAVCRCAGVPVDQWPVCWCAGVPVCQCASLSRRRSMSGVPVCQCVAGNALGSACGCSGVPAGVPV
jgi:hypothetical protein